MLATTERKLFGDKSRDSRVKAKLPQVFKASQYIRLILHPGLIFKRTPLIIRRFLLNSRREMPGISSDLRDVNGRELV